MRTVQMDKLKDDYRIVGTTIDHASHVISLVQEKKTKECFTIRMDIGCQDDKYTLKPTC
jgi:hypothetical protein